MKNRCTNYDKEFECCRILSDWSEAMPALQPCIESPCKYFKSYTNYDRIKSMSVEEMAEYLSDHWSCVDCAFEKDCDDNYISCHKNIKQWLESEVEE